MTNRESVGVDTEDGLYMASDNNNVPETQKNHTVMVFIGVVVISIFIGLIISFILIEGGYVG